MISVSETINILLQGSYETLLLASVSCIFGLILGVLFAFLQFYFRYSLIQIVFKSFCVFVQSLPEILILFSIYFGLSALLSFFFQSDTEVSGFLAGTTALALIFGCYASKIFHSALLLVLKEEIEVSYHLGLSKFQTFYHIIWPQIWRYALPGLGSLWLIMLKDTVLISLIGGYDLMSRAQILIHNTHQPFKFYLLIAGIYLILTFVSEHFLKKAESHARRIM